MLNDLETVKQTLKDLERKNQKRESKIQRYLDLIDNTQSYIFRIIALLFLVCVEIVLFIALFSNKNPGTGLLTAITLIAILPILVIRVFDISVLNLSKEGIQAELLRTEMDEALSKVDRLFAHTMSKEVAEILSLLSGSELVKNVSDEHFKRRLFYLQDIGYIKFDPDILNSEEAVDLQPLIKVTESGKEFIDLRSRLSIK